MEETDNLILPYILPSQAQKHVTHNEALRILDVLVQACVQGVESAPPSSPPIGSCYIVGAAGTDVFAGRTDAIASWSDGAWMFYGPRPGWRVYDRGGDTLLVYDGDEWASVSGSIEEVDRLGVGTAADDLNRLAVASASSLFTHVAGDHRLKVNKASAFDTASLVFQNDYSGRAEMGIAGSDDFALKVTPDGTVWHEGLRVDAASGRVRFPSGGVREQLEEPRSYFVATDGDDENDGLDAAHPFLTIQAAVNAALALDAFGHQVTILVADGTYSGTVLVQRPMFDGGTLIIRGNTSTPANVQVGGPGLVAFRIEGAGIVIRLEGLAVSGSTAIWARYGAVVLLRVRMVLGACSLRQINADTNAYVDLSGQIEVAGGAQQCLQATQGGHILLTATLVTLTGAPSFSNAFVSAANTGLVSIYGNAYSGTASGTRYRATGNGVVFVNGAGATALPGNLPGEVATGGQYV